MAKLNHRRLRDPEATAADPEECEGGCGLDERHDHVTTRYEDTHLIDKKERTYCCE